MFETHLQFLLTTHDCFEGVNTHLDELLVVYVLTISAFFKVIFQLL